MATKGGQQSLPLTMLRSMNGIFHRLVLVAAGDMLCPFSRKKLEIGEASSGASCLVLLAEDCSSGRAEAGVAAEWEASVLGQSAGYLNGVPLFGCPFGKISPLLGFRSSSIKKTLSSLEGLRSLIEH